MYKSSRLAAHYRRHKLLLILIAILIVAAMILLLDVRLGSGHQTKPNSKTSTSAEPKPVTAISIQSHALFVGDIYWGRSTNKAAQASPLKEAYPFSRLTEFGRGDYDAWVGNLECPSVPGVNQPYSLEVESLQFNCPTSYLPELAKWFTAVSLANNHTSNQHGQSGLEATRRALDAQGVQYFGHYDPRILNDVCEVIALPARLQQSDNTQKQVHVPVAMCGYHGLSVAPSAESLAVMKRYAAVMPAVAYPHMGTEYLPTVDSQRRTIYRSMIDNGADIVLGGHPHWVQPTEVYKGKLIVYSMGNFIFDQRPGETTRGAAIDLTLKATNAKVGSDQLEAWAALGSTCAAFRDDCLARAEQQKLQRIPFDFSYAARGVDLSGKVTHPADAALNQTILERLGWQAIDEQLKKL